MNQHHTLLVVTFLKEKKLVAAQVKKKKKRKGRQRQVAFHFGSSCRVQNELRLGPLRQGWQDGWAARAGRVGGTVRK